MHYVMSSICAALRPGGTLIIDGPDATGLLQYWSMLMLDFHTKHINHFRLLDYLNLMDKWGFTLVNDVRYTDDRAKTTAPCFRLYFQRLDMAQQSADRVTRNMARCVAQLKEIDYPVNVWGLGDISWHLLAQCDLQVAEYIDNDPAYRGQKYDGKPVLKKPTNTLPIVIMAQAQRDLLIENIRKAGVTSRIIEIG
jgi:hypothetical protein